MAIDSKINNIIGSKLPQWLLNQLHQRSLQNSVSGTRDNNNILYVGNKSSWVRLISSVNIVNETDIEYFKGIIGTEIFNDETNNRIQNAADLSKKYILYGGTSKYLKENSKKSYKLRSGIDVDGAYGMLGESEINKFGYKPMPGITSVNIETQGRLGSLRAATINFKCWNKNQLDIIDTLYFKLGYTMFLEWGHTYFYPSDKRNVSNINNEQILLDPAKISSTELFAIDPFQANLTKEQIFSEIAKNSRATEGNYDAMLGICTNFNFTYTQDGGYDCTLRVMSLGILGDSIKINNSGTLPNLLEEEIKLYNNTLARLEKAKRDAERLKGAPPPATPEKKPSDAENYPACIKEPVLPGSRLIELDTNLVTNGLNGKKPFFKYAYKAIVFINSANTEVFLYVDGRYQTVDLTKNGTYDCRNGVLFVDGKTTQKLLVNIPLDEYIDIAVKKTIDDNLAARGGNQTTTFFELFPFDKPTTPGPTFVGADRYAKFPISSNGFEPGFLVNKLSAVIPSANKDFKIKLDYVKFLEGYVNFVDSQGVADPSGFTQPIRWTEESYGDSMYIEVEYQSNSNNEKYKIKTTIEDNVTPGKVTAIDSNGIEIKDGYGKVVKATAPEKDDYETEELRQIITKLTQDLASPNELFNLVSAANPVTKADFKIVISKNVSVTFKVEVTVDSYVDGSGKTIPRKKQEQEVVHSIPVKIEFNDSYIIQGVISPPSVIQPAGFSNYTGQIVAATTTTTTTAPPAGGGGGGGGNKSDALQDKQSITSQSSLELILRTIQVHVINQTLDPSRSNKPVIVNFINELSGNNKKVQKKGQFLKQIFSVGVMSEFIDELVSGSIDASSYNTTLSQIEKFKINTKYGYATNLMANNSDISNFIPNDFTETLTAFSLPYQVDQEVVRGTSVNRPVYIPLGFLLMIINNVCTIYDTNSEIQTPLVYIDFNNNHNFFLSTPKQLSTDGFNVLIPFEGEATDFQSLFDPEILQEAKNSKTNDVYIKPPSGSKDTPARLYSPAIDPLSKSLLKVKYQKTGSNAYRGKIMNVLLSIDYLTQLVQDYSYKDGSNNVYLKPFLEQILVKINKSLGDFNALRLSYNDQGNCFQIIDDQFMPSPNEDQVYRSTRSLDPTNRTEIPLLGKKSIAKSLEIKTEVSSKLANMIAISSNSTVGNKSTLSTNGDSFGYLNTNFIDRYIPDKLEITGSNTQNSKQYDTLKIAARHFNQTILDFYVTGRPSQANVSDATNYYIEKLSKVKNEDFATRASAPIPVTINFLTDGISGMSMGNAFTIPQDLLPYTYGARKIDNAPNSGLDNIGFVVVGLTHTIENNCWNTNVRGAMYYLKDSDAFNKQAVQAQSNINNFTAGGGGNIDLAMLQGNSEIYYLANLAHNQGECGARAILKAASQGIVHMDNRDPNYRNICASNIQSNMFGVQDPYYSYLNPKTNPGNVGNKDFKPILESIGASVDPLYTPTNFILYKKAKFKEKYEGGLRGAQNSNNTEVKTLIAQAAIDYGVPEDFLLYVGYSESGLKPNSGAPGSGENEDGRYKGLFGLDSKLAHFHSNGRSIFSAKDQVEYQVPIFREKLKYGLRLKKWIDNNYQGSPNDKQYYS